MRIESGNVEAIVREDKVNASSRAPIIIILDIALSIEIRALSVIEYSVILIYRR